MQTEKVVDYIVNWLKDYATKAGVNGFVIGVSGGIDSAVASTLCAKTGLKVLYFEDKVIPFKAENERISYTEKQINWAKNNEASIWSYFVERELLFSTSAKLPSRFINPAPFSKFYLEDIDSESPGKIGQYMGWQIVKAYMQHNDTLLKDMLIMNAEDIFNKSKFKPKK